MISADEAYELAKKNAASPSDVPSFDVILKQAEEAIVAAASAGDFVAVFDVDERYGDALAEELQNAPSREHRYVVALGASGGGLVQVKVRFDDPVAQSKATKIGGGPGGPGLDAVSPVKPLRR